jgi:monovalent cation/proton antiporter MnhG/PhaG subunit
MSAGDVAADVLLALGVGLELLACLGVATMREVHDRLHFMAPATLGAMVLSTAILVHEGPSMIALKAGVLAAFLLATGPVLVHVLARSARIGTHGDWRPQSGEGIELEER